jgi:hypothetical protein
MTTPTLGAMVDKLYQARQKRLDLEKKVDLLKEAEASVRGDIIKALAASKLDGAKGKIATVAIKTSTFVRTLDILDLHKYILEDPSNRLDLLEKRPAKAAVLARMEAGEEVPGVTIEKSIDLSLTKR